MIAENIDESPDIVKTLLDGMMDVYWKKLYIEIHASPEILKNFTAFLIQPEKLVVYLGKTHVAIEYKGAERINILSESGFELSVEYNDLIDSNNLLEDIIGFQYPTNHNFSIPLPPFSEELILPTNKGFDKLRELGWNFAAQEYIIAFNSPAPEIPKGQFSRIVNSFFFDADATGLKTRHIKWIDFIPINFSEHNDSYDISLTLSYYEKLIESDLRYIYPMPNEFDYIRLQRINRFIEFIGDQDHTEPEITDFLAKEANQFILTMFFSAIKLKEQAICEWQSEDNNEIIPDFFVVRPDGFADIVEFKLPRLRNNAIVGKENRETFSSEISSYISQTRTYKNYFQDPNNRKWFSKKYGFEVYEPHRFLVVGRRSDFPSQIWREILADFRDITIITYDDLIDGVTVQFYTK